ncbi:MAG TPA: COX15/CtaA family protein [Actinomycetota bacterium]|jgi:heme A synthase
MPTRVRWLAASSTAVTVLLIAVGGVVRATGSGLGCPGWPRCFGRWIPPFEYHAVIEYSHRLVVFADVVLIGLFAAAALFGARRHRRVMALAIASFVLVFFQAALGAIVVKAELQPLLVTAHFATAMVLLAVLTLATVAALSPDAGRQRGRLSALAWGTAASIFVLLVVGAYVRGEGASLAFRDWPLMNADLVPRLDSFKQALHFSHRVLAVVVAVLVTALAVKGRRERKENRPFATLVFLLGALFVTQVLVGAANVWSRLAPAAVAAHVGLAGLIWAVAVAAAATARWQSLPSPKPVLEFADRSPQLVHQS